MQVALLVSLHDFGKLHVMKELILPTKAEETKHNTTQHQTTNRTSPHTTADPPGNPHLLLKQKHIVHLSPYEVSERPAVCCLNSVDQKTTKVWVEKSATQQGFGSRIHLEKTRWFIIPQFYWLLYFNVFKHLKPLGNKHVKYLRNLSEMFLV